ncbi:hypothetical protein N9V42_06135 [Flavobacteriaceae bacterium]|nr:hypothetical protein [Flavobacteriaceae bacterium]MDC3238727.1 hypothetical protein [Flavobacteriaceae bacterium]
MSSALFKRIICFSLILMMAFGSTNSIPEQVVQEISKYPIKLTMTTTSNPYCLINAFPATALMPPREKPT